jgi:hypothetical protein
MKEKGGHSSIIELPYTSKIKGLAGKKPMPGRKADIGLSSYTAMGTEATRIAYHNGLAPHIILTGENTFGEDNVSTAELMRRQLTRNPNPNAGENNPKERQAVPESAITVMGNLQDTDRQIEALKGVDPKLMENPLYVVMGFHKERVEDTLREHGLKGVVRSAEEILFEHYQNVPGKDLQRLKGQLEKFTPKKLHAVEGFIRTIKKRVPFNRIFLDLLRVVRGGQTVTDINYLGPASKQMKIAKKAIRQGHLEPGDITI